MTQPHPPAPRPLPTVPGGLFVSFEGGDGAGKSTQSRLLGEWLAERGLTVVLTREPGGTDLGRVLRREVLHGEHLDARTEALLYAADRAHHVASLVRPALAAGSVVVTDRYLDSSVAYQGTGRDLGAQEVEDLSLWATGGLLPALTVLLDLDPVAGLGRLRARPDQPDRLESAGDDFHRRTREAFLARAAADPGRWLVLDAARPVGEIAADVRARVSALLGTGPAPAAPGAGGAR
uniref:dTMP kinase n=1 Tax=Cellulomonas hominis TaxID=156981 RepID=UPI001E2895B1|nr:dTMP kinase [Cellulomonas hominis]